MTLNLEFTFFMPKHGYVASVMQVPDSGYAIDPPNTECFRVPSSFTKEFEAAAQTRYISDVRGHDFLSYTGRWANENTRGISKKSENIMNEIGALRALGQELTKKGFDKADFRLSLGPGPGSFFADVKKLGKYRWGGLPGDLDTALQDEINDRGYGKITNVTINATGGWVMHFREESALMRKIKGRKRAPQFCYGGEALLPTVLLTALRSGQAQGAKISHMFLNHQNPDEYLLIFNNGVTYANLHSDFQPKIRALVEIWVKKTLKKSLSWNFNIDCSCQCTSSEQSEVDAAYYHRRGQFHILKSLNNDELSCKNIDLALDYLGEAATQDPRSRRIRASQRLALVAARRTKRDAELESKIIEAQVRHISQTSFMNPRDLSPSGVFHNQYFQLIKSEEDFQNLETKLLQLSPVTTEWSYLLASGLERPILIEIDFDDDERHYSHSEELQAPTEMLGSIPSEISGQSAFAQTKNTEQSGEQGSHFQSQRRPSELSDVQHISDPNTPSLFNYEHSFVSQRRATDNGSGWSGIALMSPSAASIEQNVGAQRRLSELNSDQIITGWRRPSILNIDSIDTGQSEVQGRTSVITVAESVQFQRVRSELAADETTMVQKISKPRGLEFDIYGE